MATIIAMFTTVVVLLGLAHPALALGQARAGGVRDILADVFGLDRTLRGHVVQHREATLVLRGDDARVYTVNTAALDTAALARLKDGLPVVVSLKHEAPDATTMPIASAIRPTDGARKEFRRAEGTVQSVNDDRVVFRARDGRTVTLDRARIAGEAPHVVVHEAATLVYEQEPRVAGLWIETRETVEPSASIDTRGGPATR
jgi:hypothetical protein